MKKTLNGQWIEVFRAGEYGAKGTYTRADIDKMIANYDPAVHEAPIVLGHPESDAPAYGWVESLKRQGDILFAKLKQVQPAFEEWVRSGLFKKRSISFYKEPLSLRHVGFLGAMPPHAKGLADLQLCEFRDGEHTDFDSDFENKESNMDLEKLKQMFSEMLNNLKAELTEKFGKQPSTAVNHDEISKAIEKGLEPIKTQFAEIEQKVKDQATEIAKTKDAEAKKNQAALAEGAVAKLKGDRKWLPAYAVMGVPQIFSELAKNSEKIKITLGEGDKKKEVEKTALELFSDFLAGLPKIVPEGEIAAGAGTAARGKVVGFNESPGIELDAASVAFDEKVKERMKADPKLSYGDAMVALRREGVTLESLAGAAAVAEV